MILLVDDRPENLFSLRSLLQLHSYEVDTAASGEEALKKILRNEYALIILDVQMPEMDGYEVAEAVSSLNKTKDIPIIFLSAVNIDKKFIAKGYNSGGVDYITKPFDPDVLLLKVRTFNRLYEQQRDLKLAQAALRTEVDNRKRAQDELEKLNSSLEEIVTKRTRELVELNQGLESSNTELGQYASLASHDLQEPVRKIITFSKIIAEKYLSDIPNGQRDIQKVIESSERMRSLINDLLNYSKLSAISHFTTVDLHELLNSTLADLEIVIQEKKAKIEVDCLPEVEVVPGQIRQLFQNIITNALKFSKAGVAPLIRIRCEHVAAKKLDASPKEDGQFIRISIADNGIGFDEFYLEKMFTIFQRLHDRTEYDGTGIGLAIVKKIVEKHGGVVGAHSVEGEGSTFIIVLPIKQAYLNPDNV